MTTQLTLSESATRTTTKPTAGDLARWLSNQLDHKKDNFTKRVARRVQDGNNSVSPNADDTHAVDGCLDGDHYDAYSVNWTVRHLEMCSCYKHNFGTVRARKICTHVGAAIVEYALKHADDPRQFVESIGSMLNRSAQEYIKKRSQIEETAEDLDLENTFSENWANRARAQATQMKESGDGKWDCVGGEHEGHMVWVTKQGYKCDSCKDGKFPTPCKLGAYILNNMDD